MAPKLHSADCKTVGKPNQLTVAEKYKASKHYRSFYLARDSSLLGVTARASEVDGEPHPVPDSKTT